MLWHFLFESLLSSNLILESYSQNISHLIHLQLHKTYSLFYSFRMVYFCDIWSPPPLLPNFFKDPNTKREIKKKDFQRIEKILEYEMMNNENSSPFILGYVILHIEDKNIAWVLFGTMSYHIFLSYDLSLNFSTTMFQA